MHTTIEKQALDRASRPTTELRSSGMTPTSAPTFRATKARSNEDVRPQELCHVVVLSLALVALLELVQGGLTLAIGQPFGFPELIRDLILKVPWSILICAAVWTGLVYGRGSAVVAAIVGWVTAPVASLTAHTLAEMGASLALSAKHVMLVSPYLVAVQKGIAYATLPLLVFWLWAQTRATAWHHVAAGLAVGLVFGGALLLLEANRGMQPVTASVVVAWAVNEVLFPVGCALILWHVRELRKAAANTHPNQVRTIPTVLNRYGREAAVTSGSTLARTSAKQAGTASRAESSARS